MDDSRFDAWTRRRFGLAAGGLSASLLGLVSLDDAAAKKKRKKKKKASVSGAGNSLRGRQQAMLQHVAL